MGSGDVAELYRTYAPELRENFGHRFPWSRDVVEDAVQHAFLQLHMAKTKPDQPRAWLRTVTHHYIIDRLRAEGKLVYSESVLDNVVADSSTMTGAGVSTTMVRRALELITTRARRLLRGKYQEAKSYQTLAREEGLAPSGLGRVLDRARRRLRRAVDQLAERR